MSDVLQDEAEADGAGVRVPEAVLRLADRGEPAAAAGGGGAARDAGGPAHRALPAHPAAAPGIRAHHVPALRAHHRGNGRARRAYSPPGSRGQPLPPAPPVRGVLASIHCCSSREESVVRGKVCVCLLLQRIIVT